MLWRFGVVVGMGERVEIECGGMHGDVWWRGFEDLDGAVRVGGVEFEQGAVDERVGEVGVELLDLLEGLAGLVVVSEFGLRCPEAGEGAGVVRLDREGFGVVVEGELLIVLERVDRREGSLRVGVVGVELDGALRVVEGAVLVVERDGDHRGEGVGVGGLWVFGEQARDLLLCFGVLGLLVERVGFLELREQAVVLGGVGAGVGAVHIKQRRG